MNVAALLFVIQCSSKYLSLCIAKEKVTPVWNDMRVSDKLIVSFDFLSFYF